MPTDLQDRTQYLELALFSQNVISALLDFVDKNRQERLESLSEAQSSLDAVNSDDLKRLVGERMAAFSSYEQLKTLTDAWSAEDRNNAIEMIRDLLESPKPLSAKRAIAERLVKLFSRLQTQALRYFEQPADPALVR